MKRNLLVTLMVIAVVALVATAGICIKSYVVDQRPVQPVVTAPYLNKLAPAQVDELYTLEFPEEER